MWQPIQCFSPTNENLPKTLHNSIALAFKMKVVFFWPTYGLIPMIYHISKREKAFIMIKKKHHKK